MMTAVGPLIVTIASLHAPLARPLAITRAPLIARAPLPQLAIVDFDALQNTGETAIFDNVNVGSAVVRFLRSFMNSNKERVRLKEAVLSLSSGVDEIIFIGAYLLLVERLLKGLWKIGWGVDWLLNKDEAEAEKAEATYETSLLGALRAPARQLGWSMLLLWAVDAAYILCAAVNPALKLQVAGKKGLPYALGWVLYANVCGRALASVKNWWLERGVLAFAKPPPSAAQRAIARRGSGILLWSAVILVCAEGLAASTGIKLNSILSFAGVGGIAVGLATKDLLTNLIGGCLLFLTNPFTERDKITMSNLEQSRILRVGWYQTVVIGDNEEVMTIPNAKFISNKISNRSRRTHRCMKQSFYLDYGCLPYLKDLLNDMRKELLSISSVDSKKRYMRVCVCLSSTSPQAHKQAPPLISSPPPFLPTHTYIQGVPALRQGDDTDSH